MKEWILIATKYQEWISVLYLHKKHKNLIWGYFCKCKKLPKMKYVKFSLKNDIPKNVGYEKNMTHTK